MAAASVKDAAALVAPGVTVAGARRTLAEQFRGIGIASPDLDARLLVGHALALDLTGLVANSDRVLQRAETTLLDELSRRRLRGEPVARILGVKEFWGLPLRLNHATLVPRPETETVVEAALAAIDADGPRDRPLRIADLGTGTGALLLALLSELPHATGIGTDITPEALAAAENNSAELGQRPRTQFLLRDFGAPLEGRFELVVSNPPYIRSDDIAGLPAEVRYDPVRALDGGADGLDAYRTIAALAGQLLVPGGRIVVELGLGQEPAVAALLRAGGLVPAPAKADLAGIPRALPAVLASSRP